MSLDSGADHHAMFNFLECFQYLLLLLQPALLQIAYVLKVGPHIDLEALQTKEGTFYP